MRVFSRNWHTAYRLKPRGSILTDKETPFIRIPVKHRFNSSADPFLFNYKGQKYLFAELYDKKDGRGKIGFAKWNREKKNFSNWEVIIDEQHHLSYPNIFEWKDNIYIVPESNESNSLYAYKALEFPYKWEKLSPIITEKKLVDTTFLSFGQSKYMFTYDIDSYDDKKLWLYEIDEEGSVKLKETEPISIDDTSARPGGNFFKYKEDVIRVSQDCGIDYGVAIVFQKVKKIQGGYKEEMLQRITPEDVRIPKAMTITGIHTYNADEEIEVIDFHLTDYNIIHLIKRIIRKVLKN